MSQLVTMKAESSEGSQEDSGEKQKGGSGDWREKDATGMGSSTGMGSLITGATS